MATIDSCYISFESTMDKVIKHWQMDGEVARHHDFRNRLVCILFEFRDRYLHVRDVLDFDVDKSRKSVLDDTVRHIKEIKDQFNYYFNAIWC